MGSIDAVAAWAQSQIDPRGDLFTLLQNRAERVAHLVMERAGLDPETYSIALDPSIPESQLFSLSRNPNQSVRLTVQRPTEFEGYWFDFTRDVPASSLKLQPASLQGSVS